MSEYHDTNSAYGDARFGPYRCPTNLGGSRRLLIAVLALVHIGCASSRSGAEEEPAPGQANCVVVEIQNTSLTGLTVWIEWENRTPRRMGRVSLNAREVYTLPFRNEQFSLQFQPDGQMQRQASNAVLPTPGDRIDITYRNRGPGPLRRVGTARCR